MFEDILPIEGFNGKLSLDFVDYELKEPKYTVEDARAHDANYSAPLHVYFAFDEPWNWGNQIPRSILWWFPINDWTRNLYHQRGRTGYRFSVGTLSQVYISMAKSIKRQRRLWFNTVIPNRGAWLEMETDAKISLTYGLTVPVKFLWRFSPCPRVWFWWYVFEFSATVNHCATRSKKTCIKIASDSRTEEGL